ncbi:MAG: hypothetical protein ACXABD_11975 [Candidatus Thorarchaeota archaeon]
MARVQGASCRHCGERTTVVGRDHSWLPRWSVCKSCKEGMRLMQSYGDCDELLFMMEGQDALSARVRFRSIKQNDAYQEALKKAMDDNNLGL